MFLSVATFAHVPALRGRGGRGAAAADGCSHASRWSRRRAQGDDLSGGQLARAGGEVFLVQTPVLFMDEFSTGMDPILKRAVMEMLRARRRAAGRSSPRRRSERGRGLDDILIMNRGRGARGDVNTLKPSATP
jgi:ABC-type multidrug transport system ATPase subunit